MWKVFLFLSLGAFQYTVCATLPSPTSVIISSLNLRNVLKWTPGNGTPDDAVFRVQYAVYGDSVVNSEGKRVFWKVVQRCAEVAQSRCDLSNETWDLEQGYFARVRAENKQASSRWVLTRRFDPKSDTSFGPPQVIIEIKNNSAIVTLNGPMRYQPNNQMPVVSMATIYPQMLYNLSIKNTYLDKTSHFPVFSGLYKHLLMDYNTEYCFSAKAKFLAMPAQCQLSEWQCITMPQDPLVSQLQWAVVGMVVPLLCVCLIVVIGHILYHYLMGIGQKPPYILDPGFFNQPFPVFPPGKTNINAITVIKPADPRPEQNLEDPPLQYASYMPPQPVCNLKDLSIDYGFVSSASPIFREEERFRGCVNGENNLNHFSGVYASQTPSICSQRSFHTHLQKHRAAPDPSAPEQGVLLHIPRNLMGEMLREDGVTFSGKEDENENQLEPLVSFHAAQIVSTTHSEQPEFSLADNYSDMGLEETGKDSGGHAEEEEEQARQPIFIDWDLKSGKLVLPELAKWIHSGNEPENGREPTEGGEEEGNVMGELLLGDVFVRQASEEEEQAPREPKTDPEAGEGYNILGKWNLVFPLDG